MGAVRLKQRNCDAVGREGLRSSRQTVNMDGFLFMVTILSWSQGHHLLGHPPMICFRQNTFLACPDDCHDPGKAEERAGEAATHGFQSYPWGRPSIHDRLPFCEIS